MASRLEALPTEVLDIISSNLETRDRVELLCVSRRLYNATLRSIYRSISLSISSEDVKVKDVLRPMIETIILKKPWLAKETHELELSGIWYLGETDEVWDISASDEQLLMGAVEGLCANEEGKETWIRGLRMGNADTYVALLLMSLPNLEKLTFDILSEELDDDIHRGFFTNAIARCADREKPFDLSPRLTRLSSVTATWRDANYSEDGYDSDRIHHILKFPSMRRLCADKMIYEPARQARWTYPQHSPVTHLELYRSGSGFKDLVKSCKDLKSFIYQCDYDEEIIPSRVRTYLLPMKDTIETLCLDFLVEDEDRHGIGVFGSLSDFSTLKHLHIDAPRLIDFDSLPSAGDELVRLSTIAENLPKTLETLHISALDPAYDNEFISQLKTFARVAPGRLPSLCEILIVNIGFDEPGVNEDSEPTSKEDIEAAFAKVGIGCRFDFICDCFLSQPSASDGLKPLEFSDFSDFSDDDS